ncbi:MAG: hypothetical protein JKY71_03785 [Alphaproteobacteria bacterium]|nr:hypothetical protein [Alphaproteobacteria bacterium]
MESKYLLWGCVLIAFIGVSTFALLNDKELVHPLSIPPDYFYLESKGQIYTKTGIIEIAGRKFEIPISYVQGNFESGKIEGSVVIRYVLPDYKSLLEFPPGTPEKAEIVKKGLRGSMLLEASAARPSFDKMINNLKENRGNRLGQFQEEIYGLHKYAVLDWKGRMAKRPHDTYIEKDKGGEILSFIQCTPPNSVPVPSCSHRFRDKELLYKITWPVRELPNWKAQKYKATAFIDSFEIKPTAKSGSDKN